MKQKLAGLIPLYSSNQAKAFIQTFKQSIEDEERSIELENSVRTIINSVRERGDLAIKELAEKFGDAEPQNLIGSNPIVDRAVADLDKDKKLILDEAAKRIKRFAEAVMSTLKPVNVQYDEYQAGFDFKPVDRAACYIPAGRYPLPSTALMTAVTAKVAGVKEVAIFSPKLSDEIIYAGSIAGVTEFHQVGGAQAVAAAAYGTASIKAARILVGPGNAYVTEAKKQLYGVIGIDMLAGPSEIAVIADSSANPKWLAVDLLSQAEHDPNARAYLLCDNATLANAVAEAIDVMYLELKLPEFVKESLSKSAILQLESLDECIDVANLIAPEHLHLHLADPASIKSRLENYGALFMGYNATVPYGDYMAGPNHTLPTSRAARFSGGLSPLVFLRGQSWLHVAKPAAELARLTHDFAKMEGLTAHAAAAIARTES